MINFHKKRVLKVENLVYPKDVKQLNDSIGDTSTLIGTLDIPNGNNLTRVVRNK